MKTTLEVLEAARELISKPGAWTQGTTARNADLFPVFTWAKDACSFCAAGAIFRNAASLYGRVPGLEVLEKVVKGKGHKNVATFNDHHERTQAEVVAMFDAAIERAKKE